MTDWFFTVFRLPSGQKQFSSNYLSRWFPFPFLPDSHYSYNQTATNKNKSSIKEKIGKIHVFDHVRWPVPHDGNEYLKDRGRKETSRSKKTEKGPSRILSFPYQSSKNQSQKKNSCKIGNSMQEAIM